MNMDWLQQQAASGDQDARDAIEQNERLMEEVQRKAMETARLFHDVFCTGRGPEVLDYLRAGTVDLSTLAPHQNTFEPLQMPLNPAEWVFVREGQNSVTRHIEGLIRLAREQATQPTTQEGN